MCVGLPAKVVSLKDGMALVDASGARREVSAELLEDMPTRRKKRMICCAGSVSQRK